MERAGLGVRARGNVECVRHDLSSVPNNGDDSARKSSGCFKGGRAVRKETSCGDLRRCKNQHGCTRESHNECRLSLATREGRQVRSLWRTCSELGLGEEIRMSDCCSVNAKSGSAPAVMPCPVNGGRSKRVDSLTVKRLVLHWPLGMPNTQYYFCEASDCEVVYFALDAEAPRLRPEDLVVRVGAKEAADATAICYCFGVTR